MVKHIVMFKLSGDADFRLYKARSFKDALEALPRQIECLNSIEVGINQNPNECWDVVLTAVLESIDDVDVYAKHPAHVAAASIISDCKADRACVDIQL